MNQDDTASRKIMDGKLYGDNEVNIVKGKNYYIADAIEVLRSEDIRICNHENNG